MPSGNGDRELHPSSGWSAVLRVLGSAFGLFVWAAHFLIIRIGEAVACQRAVVSVAMPNVGLIALLATVTVAAALIVGVHGFLQWRRPRPDPEGALLARIAVGQDVFAAIAVLWQLIPLLTVPLCR